MGRQGNTPAGTRVLADNTLRGSSEEGQTRTKTAGQWKMQNRTTARQTQKAPNLDRRGQKGQWRKPTKEGQMHEEVGVEKWKKAKKERRK